MRSRSFTNFLKGAGSIFDLFPSDAYETEQGVYIQIGDQKLMVKMYSPSFTDYIALKNDWIIVGDSLRSAVVKLIREENLESKEEKELIDTAEQIATVKSC